MTVRNSRRLAASLALALSSALIGSAALADSSRTRARALFVEAKGHYAKGEYRKAVRAFRAAGKLRPSPLLDFNIGRCQERLGQLRPAIRSYQRYLRGRPDAANAKALRSRIASLKRRARDPYEDLEGSDRALPPPHEATSSTSAPSSAPASQATSAPTSRPSGPATAAPAPGRSRMAGERYEHEAMLPVTRGQLGRATAGKPPRGRPHQGKGGPLPRRPGRKPTRSRPFYKEWSFWVGVGAVVVITGVVVGLGANQDGGGSSSQNSGGLRLAF